MAIYIADDLKAAASQSRLASMSARPSSLALKLYDGTQPSAGGSVTNQTLLFSANLSNPIGSVSGHTLTLTLENSLNQVTATGTPTWGRIVDHSGNWVLDATAGVAGSGSVFVLDQVPIQQGGYITAISMTITEQ